MNTKSETKSSIPALREDDESNIPCKFDKYCEPEVIIGRMLTNFNMVNAFTGQSCPIVHLGDLAKIRVKKKRLVRCEGSIVATPLKSAIPPLLTKVEWEALLEGLCNPYKEGHERHFISLYRGEMTKCMQDGAYRTFVSRPMTLEILLENLRTGFTTITLVRPNST